MHLTNLDALDFQIFRAMGFMPFGPGGVEGKINPWRIAEKLGVDGNTVKLRLRRMEKLGFIKYYQVYPNYRLLGVEGVVYLFDAPQVAAKYEAIQKTKLVDGIVEVHDFFGGTFCVHFVYHDARDHDKRLSLLKEVTKCPSCIKFYERVMPTVNITLNSLDWSIIKSLRYSAFKRLSKVAEELRVSIKTVKRRLDRMASSNALIVFPVMHPGDVPNVILYGLLFFIEEEGRQATVREILQSYQPFCLMSYTPPKGNIMLLNFARSVEDAEAALLRAKSIKGVADARLLIMKEMHECPEWMDREIEKKVVEAKLR